MFENDEVIMLPAGEYLMLSLWSIESFTAEIGTAPAWRRTYYSRAQLRDGKGS